MLQRLILPAMLMLAATALPAHADQIACHGSDTHYVVLIAPSEDTLETRVLAGKRANPNARIDCSAAVAAPINLTVPDTAVDFLGLSEHFLVLGEEGDSGSDMVIHDLDSGAELLRAAAEDVFVDSSGAYFFEVLDTPASAKLCPEYDAITAMGMAAALAEQRVYDFASGKVEKLEGTRCYARA
ncbi:hypothetical protein [Devosia sp. FKR38]|uniref:hypothetical protein n=1 Tax=Devosia sp. FKR38 TaxID=2562312 RepID=UPI0010C0BFBE|nr:hypothetical protein [Devosia sp. FKR38]